MPVSAPRARELARIDPKNCAHVKQVLSTRVCQSPRMAGLAQIPHERASTCRLDKSRGMFVCECTAIGATARATRKLRAPLRVHLCAWRPTPRCAQLPPRLIIPWPPHADMSTCMPACARAPQRRAQQYTHAAPAVVLDVDGIGDLARNRRPHARLADTIAVPVQPESRSRSRSTLRQCFSFSQDRANGHKIVCLVKVSVRHARERDCACESAGRQTAVADRSASARVSRGQNIRI